MPQTRKRKVQEKNENVVKEKSSNLATRKNESKNKNSDIPEQMPNFKRKKQDKDSLHCEGTSTDKRSKSKKSAKQEYLSPRKDPKLSKAQVNLHSVDSTKKLKDSKSKNLQDSPNSTDSGIMIDTISDTTKGETLEMFIKSEPSSSKCESSSSESEWEEVEDSLEPNLEDYEPDIPKEGVEITIDCPELRIKKRKKKEFDENEWIRLHINRVRKGIQLSVHKVHLLCLVAHGIYVNKVLNCDTVKALALSSIPNDIFSYTTGKKLDKIDVDGLNKIISWFRNTFAFENEKSVFVKIFSSIVKSFESKISSNASEYNLMFIVIARMLGFKVRLCISLYPVTYKARNLIKKPNSKRSSKVVDSEMSQKLDECSEDNKRKKKRKISKQKKVKEDVNKEKKVGEKISRPKRSSKKRYKLSSDEDDMDDDNDKDFEGCDDSSDEDIFKPTKNTRKSINKTNNQNMNRKILSSDSEPSSPSQSVLDQNKIVCWAEVFLKSLKQWVSIECANNVVNKPYDIEILAPQPVTYILAYDNESYVKDVTRRYCNEYMTSTIKLRVDSEWWEETLYPFLPPNSKQNKDEEKNLEEILVSKPLPHTIQGFKNHPLYALKRHLLKFEAIYPSDAPSIGFIRGEPVYARECVHQLHSRETWLKEARVVRIGEQPYKIVKARPKWDRIAGVMRTDLPLDVFGIWQTEPYEPPIAVNGKVPRNEYGNVELFKPSMLPRGTVHLQLPGLNRIAKKLGIDCSPAVVGFDGHKGSVHPVFDGFVICEEFKDTILAAFDEEQENIRKREEEKREKRIYGNWKKLIKGLLIRERIKLKYETK